MGPESGHSDKDGTMLDCDPKLPGDADPIEGLLHGPQPAPWDMSVEVWGTAFMRTYEGQTGGWRWATDASTICGYKLDETDVALPGQKGTGAKCLHFLTGEFVAPLYTVDAPCFAPIGGTGQVPPWPHRWDLDRVGTAGWWVADSEDGSSKVVCALDGDVLRMAGPTGRVAVVMRVAENDLWAPTIDLPMTLVTTEEVERANGK